MSQRDLPPEPVDGIQTTPGDEALLAECADALGLADPPPAFLARQACALYAWHGPKPKPVRR